MATKKINATAIKEMSNAELNKAFDQAVDAGDDRVAELCLAETNRRGAKGPDRRAAGRQRRAIAKDRSVGYAIKVMARELGVPAESVHLVLPWGRKARTDSSIDTFRNRWEDAQ